MSKFNDLIKAQVAKNHEIVKQICELRRKKYRKWTAEHEQWKRENPELAAIGRAKSKERKGAIDV